MNKAILSILGRDRPGIVAAVARGLLDLDCNIENVSMAMLQTEFAGIFLVGMPEGVTVGEIQETLVARLSPLELQVIVKPCALAGPEEPAVRSEPFVITSRGPDRKGLVAHIAEVIARHGVNITRLQAVFKGGSHPGENLMIFEVEVPEAVDAGTLRRDLHAAAERLGLEINLQHSYIFETLHRI